MKRLFARAKALLPCIALGVGWAQTGPAQAAGIVISNYSSLNLAVSQGGVGIFTSNATINLSGGAEILVVSTALILDGGRSDNGATNTATITRVSGSGPLFYIRPGGKLTLLNLTISGGLNTNGGAIFNDTNGALLISNCVFSGNSATNYAGVAGTSGSAQGDNNGGNGGNGLSAAGGAIFSRGALEVYYSIFDNNSVTAGNGGNGGNGIQSFAFGGNGGNGGSGGGAQGGAIVCAGPTNIIVATDFTENRCAAGNGGTAGSPATGAFSGNPGSGGIGGSSAGGAILASGPVWMTNCLFSGNTAAGGSTGSFNQAGGAASGGGVALSSSTNASFIENTTFYQNSCQGGAGGGNSSLNPAPAGNGGSAVGGGLASGAAFTFLRNCTLATNDLTGGLAGGSTTSQSNGLAGRTLGFDLARTAGRVEMAGCLLYGGTNATVTNLTALTFTTYITNTQPNDYGGATDLGYNLSSDTSVTLLSALGSIENVDPVVDTGLSQPGNTAVGLSGSASGSTLAVLAGSPAIGVIPGIPGISFPAIDQVFQPRSTPATIGAYEANSLDTNAAVPPPQNYLETAGVATNAGDAAQFAVGTNGNPAGVGYQWQFDGTNLMDGGRISGAWSNILTINPVTTNDMGSYSVLIGVSTLVAGGVISSDTGTLTVSVPVKIEVEPPKTVKPAPDTPLNLSVTATGAEPLGYQWYVNETNALSDSPEITGSTTSELTIYPLAPDNAGNYLVVVSNAYGSVTSSMVTLSIPAPTVDILPTVSKATTPTVSVQGTAAGEFGVTNVLYQLNGGGWNSADTANQWANWSATLPLQAGTNSFKVYSVDLIGQKSGTNSLAIFYTTYGTLTLATNGSGRTTPGLTGSPLVIGSNYAVLATPNPGWLFSGWTGAVNTTNNPLAILLESNTALAANFIPNFFIPAAGNYNGLFSPAGGVSEQTSGMISGLALKTNGVFSGRLFIAGTNYTLAGSFNVSGQAAVTVGPAAAPGGRAPPPGGPLQVELTLEPGPPSQIVGTVTSALGRADLTAGLATTAKTSAEYTLLFSPPGGAAANTPPGFGYALVTNNAGLVTLAGALADGTAFNQTAPVSESGELPVYVSLYKNTGLLFGWVNLNRLASSPPASDLTWILPPGAASLYPGGFTSTLPVEGALWVPPPANTPAIAFTNELLVVSNSSFALTFNVAISNNNALAKLGSEPVNSLTGSINPRTGFLSVTNGNGNGQAANIGAGAVLQPAGSGGGFFVTAAGGGLVSLQTALAPVIIEQPAGQNIAPNLPVELSVQAIGSPPLSYQWMMNGTDLTNGGNISGAKASQLNISAAGLEDAGTYSVVVSNSGNPPVTSAGVLLTVPPPTLAILPTVSNVTAQADTVEGTAAGEFGVAGVQYQLNGGAWMPAAITRQTNWSATVALQTGMNTFSAYSVDPIGQTSPTNSAAIFYSTESALDLLTNGYGTIKPGFTNTPGAVMTGLSYANLVVGASYTVTAAPGPGNLFSNWTGSITTTSNPLTFLMQSNMTLTANFVTNFFLPAAGIYNGLFSNTGGVAEETAGLLYNLALQTNGVYSGRLYIAGTNYSLFGSFDIFGRASNSFGTASAPGGLLVVNLTLEEAPANQIVGTVSSNSWVANLTAEPAAASVASAEYTMLFSPPAGAAANTPPGAGYALVTNQAGMVTLTGALADGTAFNQTVAESQSCDLPVYASLYSNTGLLFGWVNLTNLGASPPASSLTWIKKPSAPAAVYASGFTNTLPVQGALWINPPTNSPVISFPKGSLLVTNDSLDLDFTVAVLNNNTLAKLGGAPANSLTGSIVAKTGKLTLNFGNGNGTNTTQGLGAVLQDQNTAGGFFLTATNAGALLLLPGP